MIKAQAFCGIDPSLTHTGLVILNPRGDILCQQAIVTKPSKDGWRGQVKRQQRIVDKIQANILEYVLQYGSAMIMIEDYAPGRFMKTVIPSVELGGLMRAMLAALLDVSVSFVSPATLKQFATGKGNADKVAVAVALSKRFGVDFGGDDGLYDAYSAARLALAVGGNYDGLTGMQVKIAEKFR